MVTLLHCGKCGAFVSLKRRIFEGAASQVLTQCKKCKATLTILVTTLASLGIKKEEEKMKKIETIFDRGENFKVTPKIRPGTEWVFAGEGVATEKLDGTNIRLTVASGNVLQVEKRRNPTREEKTRGVEPGYIDAHREDPMDKHIFRAVEGTDVSAWENGVYPCEAIGPKIQGNPLGLTAPTCYPFTLKPTVVSNVPRTFAGLLDFFKTFDSIYSPGHKAEGIVFHHPDGRMAKIKVKDF